MPQLVIRGARTHNLKGVDLTLPEPPATPDDANDQHDTPETPDTEEQA